MAGTGARKSTAVSTSQRAALRKAIDGLRLGMIVLYRRSSRSSLARRRSAVSNPSLKLP